MKFAFAFLALAAVAVAREALPNNTDTDMTIVAGGKATTSSSGNTVSLDTADMDPTDELPMGGAAKSADKLSMEKTTEKTEATKSEKADDTKSSSSTKPDPKAKNTTDSKNSTDTKDGADKKKEGNGAATMSATGLAVVVAAVVSYSQL
ncbi:hypothetical protein H4R35_004644 [Dimargaris xerosporica]|nr:hypothetical protein H4R35_004644 [Dimargaris xerosporica]